jgi:hypothetical protein
MVPTPRSAPNPAQCIGPAPTVCVDYEIARVVAMSDSELPQGVSHSRIDDPFYAGGRLNDREPQPDRRSVS